MSRSRAERSACVSLHELPIQLLRRRRPQWRGKPVAVAADESPDSPLTHLSQEARAAGLRRGLRQGAARSLVLDLCTAVVTPEEVVAAQDELCAGLRAFSPRVEVESRFDGAFFVDPNGLGPLYGGMRAWAETVHQYLRARQLQAAVVVGFQRYRTLVVARRSHGARVVPNPRTEREQSDGVSLRELGIDESLCDPLAMLGVLTLGDLLRLPAGELHTRFGREAAELHGLFSENRQLPMQPRKFVPPRRIVRAVEPAEADLDRLVAHVELGLTDLLRDLEGRGERLRSLEITLKLEKYGRTKLDEDARTRNERIEPATPTRDAHTLMELVRLRLARRELKAPVEAIVLEAEGAPLGDEQLMTPDAKPRRDPIAASRAFARLRALYGPRTVSIAQVRDAHLPEARYRMVPLENMASPGAAPRTTQASSDAKADVTQALLKERRGKLELVGGSTRRDRPTRLQRRVHAPRAVETDERGAPRLPGRVRMLFGPQRVAGGWWGSPAKSTQRDYYYAEVEDGTLYWVFFDARRGRWFVQGYVD